MKRLKKIVLHAFGKDTYIHVFQETSFSFLKCEKTVCEKSTQTGIFFSQVCFLHWRQKREKNCDKKQEMNIDFEVKS